MPVRTKGFREAARKMRQRKELFTAQNPTMYRDYSLTMRKAINENADESYTNSPAKDKALASADKWNHSATLHLMRVMTLFYANYRQYGCGGLPISKLVVVTEANRQTMKDRTSKAFHDTR